MRYQLLGGFRMSCGRSSCYQPLCFLPDVACAPQVGHLKATCKKGSGPAKSIKKTKSGKPEKRAPAVRILPIPACVCARLLFGVCVCVLPRDPLALRVQCDMPSLHCSSRNPRSLASVLTSVLISILTSVKHVKHEVGLRLRLLRLPVPSQTQEDLDAEMDSYFTTAEEEVRGSSTHTHTQRQQSHRETHTTQQSPKQLSCRRLPGLRLHGLGFSPLLR